MTAIKPAIKEHPVLFSAPMVRAILEGRKTQTRRVINPQPERHLVDCDEKGWYYQVPEVSNLPGIGTMTYMSRAGYTKCPYGQIGHRLWVRETWRLWDAMTDEYEGDIHAGKIPTVTEENLHFWKKRVEYRATSSDTEGTWRPSIFMPRWASRISLEITDIRVGRLQEITTKDIVAEGYPGGIPLELSNTATKIAIENRLDWWSKGWDSLNGKRKGCDWQSNPFVWVVEFQKI